MSASQSPLARRRLRFATLDEIVADAERLIAAPAVTMLGRWPLDRLLSHLAFAVDGSIDGMNEPGPWALRLIGPLVKRWALRRGFSPGVRLPKPLQAVAFPTAASLEDAFQKLRAAVARTRVETMSARHPIFGRLTHDEWTQFHLRHAELHLSFAVP